RTTGRRARSTYAELAALGLGLGGLDVPGPDLDDVLLLLLLALGLGAKLGERDLERDRAALGQRLVLGGRQLQRHLRRLLLGEVERDLRGRALPGRGGVWRAAAAEHLVDGDRAGAEVDEVDRRLAVDLQGAANTARDERGDRGAAEADVHLRRRVLEDLLGDL